MMIKDITVSGKKIGVLNHFLINAAHFFLSIPVGISIIVGPLNHYVQVQHTHLTFDHDPRVVR
jgi:hypothetical protein